ncbi:hypothetical protein [Cognataquiflexum rubidum]|uniref:hypothetical protein n=1 Tax=Cognataquiflexum rubidum TaxID=2922273 RepID=UPI001F145FE1|nr:hypothetical protein [Cognataquiflexum rubidum]MCH6233392.1 hypothetical protein [Cognataquiflexum rubidum]
MAFFVTDGWSVAHHHIHEAFIHLGNACRINLDAMNYYKSISEDTHPVNFLSISSELSGAYSIENKECIKATILFQAGMEAWISWAYTKHQLNIVKSRYFKQKWTDAYNHLAITYDFNPYSTFYDNFRNPIVHPSTNGDIDQIANIKSEDVYKGFQAGWDAMAKLSNGLGTPFELNSWDIMCNANGVILPNKISELGNIKGISGDLLAKMQKFYDDK